MPSHKVLGPLGSDEVSSVGVDDLDGAVGAHADLVTTTSLVAVLIGGEETTLAVRVPDDGAACATRHEVATLDVADPDVVVAPDGSHGGLALDGGVDGLLGDDDVRDAEGGRDRLGGDVGTALRGVEEAVEVGLKQLAPLEAVEDLEGQDHRVRGLSDECHLLERGVDVLREIDGVEVGFGVGHRSVGIGEGGGIHDRGSGLNLVIQHHLVHAELGGHHLSVEEIAHLLGDLVIDTLLVTVFLGLVAVPLEALVAFVVGAGRVALLALLLEEFALADAELGIAAHLALAAVDWQDVLRDVVLILVDSLHKEGADVLTWDGIGCIVHGVLSSVEC